VDVYHLDRDVLEIGWRNLATAISVVQDCKLDGVTYHCERIVAVGATRMDLGEGRDDDIVAVVALAFQDHAVAHAQSGGYAAFLRRCAAFCVTRDAALSSLGITASVSGIGKPRRFAHMM